MIFGPEGLGVVGAIGADVTTFAVGDHVVMTYMSCGRCDICESGHSAHCEDMAPLNFGVGRLDGSSGATDAQGHVIHDHFFGQATFAEYALANERNVLRVPKDVPPELLGPLCRGSQTGAGLVLNALKVHAGSSFVAFGTGAVGLSAILAAALAGATTIIAADINPARLGLALGATYIVNSKDEDPVAGVREITGKGAGFALECSGRSEVLRQGIDCLGIFGVCGIVGATKQGIEVAFDVNDVVILSTPDLGDYRSQTEGERHGDELFAKWKVDSLEAARALPAAKLTGATAYRNIVADGALIPIGGTSRTVGSDVPAMMGYMLNDLFAPSPKVDPATWAADVQKRYGADAAAFLRYYPGRTTAEARRSAAREAGDRLEFGPIPLWVAERPARSPVYVYRFSHVEPGPDSAQYGAFHTSELPYMFDTLDTSSARRFTAVDRRVVSGAIENFVKHSDPNGPELPKWSALTPSGKALMEFGDAATPSRIYPKGADDIILRGQAPARR